MRPQAEEEINFSGNCCWARQRWMVGVVNLAVLARVLRATTKKRKKVINFLGK